MFNKMKQRLYEFDENISQLPDDELLEYLVYTVAHERTLTDIEAHLHSVENPEEIAMYALKATAEFYDGDWCGTIEGDLEMGAWAPVIWYNVSGHGMTPTNFKDMEETMYLERWVDAIYHAEPIIIPDTSAYKETNPEEYEIYQRLHAHSILAVPFWKNPVGFLIVRNPKRFVNRSSFLQALAYVVFSSTTEKKLIERSQKAFSPEQIRSDKDVIINIFGNLEIYTSKGTLIEELNSPKISRFLVYLLLHKDRPAAPRMICDEIWADEDNDNPGSKAKNLAFRLQSAFSIVSDYRLVVSTPQGYQINPELNIITDVDMFEEYWVQSQSAVTLETKIELLKQAIALYRGDILPTASSEHWLMPHELAYRYKCIGIYNELLKALFEAGNYTGVQHYASAALKLDRANVDAYYWLIRTMKIKDSAVLAKGELQLASHALTDEEYRDLIERLEKTTP